MNSPSYHFPIWTLAQHGALHSGLGPHGTLGPSALGPQCRHRVEWHLTQKRHLALKGRFERSGEGGRRRGAADPPAVHWWAYLYLWFCVSLLRKHLASLLTASVEGSSERELGAGIEVLGWILPLGPPAGYLWVHLPGPWNWGHFRGSLHFHTFLSVSDQTLEKIFLSLHFLVSDSLWLMSWKSA